MLKQTTYVSKKWPLLYHILVSVCVVCSLSGASIVFLELMGGIMADLLQDTSINLSACIWLVIIAGALVPVTWLGTPKDFW